MTEIRKAVLEVCKIAEIADEWSYNKYASYPDYDLTDIGKRSSSTGCSMHSAGTASLIIAVISVWNRKRYSLLWQNCAVRLLLQLSCHG